MSSAAGFRFLASVAIIVASLGCAADGVAAATPSEPTKTLPGAPNETATARIEFYLAHGDADACGRNCNEWIVAEGKIDVGAADRLRQLLVKLGNRRPPIFFHSGGGSVQGWLALGRFIHEKKLQVSVAHTIAIGCSRDKPADNACEARKRSGQPIEAAFDPTIALCNSGCVYALAGGAVRLVPPWVKLGIHDVGLDPKEPRGALFGLAEEAAHMNIHDYLHSMGIDVALLKAATAVPYKSVRPLQRAELVRFGIDRREFGETAWQVFEKPKLSIRKRFFVRTDKDPASYVNALISIDCGSGLGMHVVFAREHLASDSGLAGPAPAAVNINIDGKPIGLYRNSTVNFYIRGAQVASKAFDAVGDDATIELPGTELGQKEGPAGNVTLNMEGFSAAYGKLRKQCPEAGRISAGLVQTLQKYNPIGGTKPPAGNVWPTNNQRPAIAQNAPGPPAMPPAKLELTRVAAAEQKLRLDFLYAIQPDCSPSGEVAVRVTEQPQHGTLVVEDGQAFTNFPKANQRYVCNTRKSDGRLIFYQPKPDYLGTDSITVYVIFPAGFAQTRHYSIDVK